MPIWLLKEPSKNADSTYTYMHIAETKLYIYIVWIKFPVRSFESAMKSGLLIDPSLIISDKLSFVSPNVVNFSLRLKNRGRF